MEFTAMLENMEESMWQQNMLAIIPECVGEEKMKNIVMQIMQ
jgi:hypothetical protein